MNLFRNAGLTWKPRKSNLTKPWLQRTAITALSFKD